MFKHTLDKRAWPKLRYNKRFYVGLLVTALFAIILLTAICTTVYIIVVPEQFETFTEFYILGPSGNASGYPVLFRLGEQMPITVWVVNKENRNMTYDVAVVLLNNTADRETLYSEYIMLGENETWNRTIELKPGMAGTMMKMDFLLYADNDTLAPYRECYLWINVTEPE